MQTPAPASVADILGRTLERIVRVYAITLAVTIIVLLPVTQVQSPDVQFLPAPVRWTIGLAVAAASIVLAFVPWSRVATTPRGQRTLVAYPATIMLIIAALTVVREFNPVLAVFGMMTLSLAGLVARLGTLAFLAGVVMVATGVALGTQPEIDVVTAGVAIFGYPLIGWMSWTTGRSYQHSLHGEVRERDASRHQAQGLRAIAAASRQVQVLEPAKVLQAVADVTLSLDWNACGIYVPAPDGSGFELGGYRGIDPSVVAAGHRFLGVLDEVNRTGQPAAFECQEDQLDEDARAGDLGTAAGAPIFVHGDQRGAIVVGREDQAPVDETQIGMLELLADTAGRALEIAEQYERQQATVVELERLNQLKQDFLATVSHELRTPLAVVLGMAETMDTRWEALDEPLRRDMTSRLHSNAAGLEGVIEALLDFSRLESGIVQPRRKAVAMTTVVNDVLDRISSVTTTHDIGVDVGDQNMPMTAWGDPLLLERVVENLVTNACRHTPPGTSIRVGVRTGDDVTIVEVADDGPGIPRADLDRLGQRFFRGGDPLTRSTRGLGLGLAFCSEILLLHDSELRITSDVGVGSTFAFSLPVSERRS